MRHAVLLDDSSGRRIRPFLPAIVFAIVLLSIIALVHPPLLSGQFRSFNSYYELRSFVLGRANQYQNLLQQSYGSMRSGVAIPGTNAEQSTPGGFTTTNVQVEGVDEPDIVKTDGTYLYVVSQNNVYIIQAYPTEQPRILSKLTYSGSVDGLFLSQDRLAVIGSQFPATQPLAQSDNYYGPLTAITIYDIADKAKPTVVKELSLQGGYINSRLTSGYIYAIVQQPAIVYGSWGNVQVTFPTIQEDSKNVVLSPSEVYFNPASNSPISTYTIILAIRISDGMSNAISILTGFGSTIYASLTSIYLTFPNNPIMPLIRGTIVAPSTFASALILQYSSDTTIFRIGISEGQAKVAASGTVPGRVLNQFSMDEYKAYFRVATTSSSTFDDQTYVEVNNVYVLDEGLSIVGSVQGLAPNEHIYAVRFMAERAYVVTFEKVDPLFAISLDDPRQPRVVNELKMPGFSQYLHPIGSGYIIGIGKDAVPSEEGNFAWYQGLKLSLFHDDNGDLTEVAKLLIGDRGSDTPVLNDHKAFTYDAERSMMALPVLVAKVKNGYGPLPPYTYGEPVWQGALLFHITTQGFELVGNITQMPRDQVFNGNYQYFVNRVVLIGNFVYTISEQALQVNDLETMSQLTTIQLQ
jgi:inhibitor of cysteine peptidase